MKASTFGLLALVAAQPHVVQNPDVKITIRRTFDRPNSSMFTETVYLKGARRREERLVELPPTISEGRTHRSTTISLCDERRRIDLNDDARTYAGMPFDNVAERLEQARLRASSQPPPDTSGPDVKIIVDSVDTGERRMLGRHVARHIVTTTTTEAAPGAHHRSGTDERDGWYIDLPECAQQGDPRAFALLVGEVARPGEPLDRVRIERRGTARRGYAIEETSRAVDAGQPVEKTELIEFSEAALDPRLFTIPRGYRPALPQPNGGFDMMKPDTLTNRVELYCGLLASWVHSFFR